MIYLIASRFKKNKTTCNETCFMCAKSHHLSSLVLQENYFVINGILEPGCKTNYILHGMQILVSTSKLIYIAHFTHRGNSLCFT